MSDFSDAFQELRVEADKSTGRKGVVKINGKTYPAILEEISLEEIITNDGNGDSGGFRAMVAVEDHSRKPKQGAAIEADGLEVSILSVDLVNGCVWNIVAGDPATE